ncbi:isochorismatase hydrolase, partial [Pseudomonas amygdali pv. mori str. 301020]
GPVIASINKACAAARAAGIPVIFFQNGWDPAYVEAGGPGSPNWHKSNALKTMRKRPELEGQLLAKGGWDYQLVDELFGIGIGGGRFDVGTRSTCQIAIGNVVGDRVVEQRDVLVDLGYVPAQVAQAVIIDFNAIEQDAAHLVPVKTRYQIGQGRFTAAGTAYQRNHLPRRCGETDVVQHLTLGLRVEEAEVLHLQVAGHAITLDRAGIDFFFHVQLFEDALGTGDTFLDRRTDFRQLANRL